MPIDLTPILNHLPAWLLVMFRITGIFMMAPMFGSRTIPAKIKILFALGLSIAIYPILLSPGKPAAVPGLEASLLGARPPSVPVFIDHGLSLWTVAPAVAMELMVGLLIGYSVSLPLVGMQMGGRIIDQQMGLGVAGIFNPELNEQSGVVSQFFFITALAIFLISGGHYVILATLVDSFGQVPLGGFRPDGHMLDLIIGLLASMFDMALRVGAPLLCLIFLQTVAMGFVARTVPQMNILSIGFALRIMVGALLLIGAVKIMAGVFEDGLLSALDSIRLFFTPLR